MSNLFIIIKKIKKDYKKKLMKDIKIFLKFSTFSKSFNNMVGNITKISQKMKNESLLSIEKNIIE